jgi:hypothetical protein
VGVIYGDIFRNGAKTFRLKLYLEVQCKLLKLAAFILSAVTTINMVCRKDQFGCGSLEAEHALCFRVHYHAVRYWHSAGSDRLWIPLDFNKAEAAAGIGFFPLLKRTQIGDIHAIVERYPQE